MENTVPVNSITSLAKVYMVECGYEGKSMVTIEKYQDKQEVFGLVFKGNQYPDDLKKVGFHFMWQLMNCPASLHNPWWGSDGISPLRPAGQIVVNQQYRGPFVLFP